MKSSIYTSITKHCIIVAGLLSGALSSGYASAQDTNPPPFKVVVRQYDRQQLLNSSATANETWKGRAIWLQRCAYCHDGFGQPTYNTMGPWLGADVIQLMGEAAFRTITETGTEHMPGFRYTLRPEQVGQLIEFLNTVTSDQKPTPAQLAARSSGIAPAAAGK